SDVAHQLRMFETRADKPTETKVLRIRRCSGRRRLSVGWNIEILVQFGKQFFYFIAARGITAYDKGIACTCGGVPRRNGRLRKERKGLEPDPLGQDIRQTVEKAAVAQAPQSEVVPI